MRLRHGLPVLAAVLAATSGVAAAHPSHPWQATAPSRASGEEEVTSYRAQTLTVDGISIGLFLLGRAMEGADGRDNPTSSTLMGAGIMGSMLASPIVHAVQGHGWRALGSFGIRYGCTTAGVLVAMAASSGCDGLTCSMEYVGLGVLGGMVVASALDAGLLTEERRERPPAWTPTVSAHADGARVGIVGTF